MKPLFIDATALRIIDSLAIVFAQAYQLVRMRLASNSSPVIRIVVERDQMVWEFEILRRDFAVLQGQRENMPPHRRPTFSPEQRLAIIQIMRLRNWNAKRIADRFVLHVNTVQQWIKAVDGRSESSTLLDVPRWNRIDDAVRWAAHELRRLCPAPEFGTRTIARHLLRSGIQVSRSSVQRMLRENKPAKPRKPRPPMITAMGVNARPFKGMITPKKSANKTFGKTSGGTSGGGGWGRDFDLLRRELEYRYEGKGTKKFINVLLLFTQYSEDEVRQAVSRCVQRRAFSDEAVLGVLRNEPIDTTHHQLDLSHRPQLLSVGNGIRPVSIYDCLLQAQDVEVAV